LLTDARFEGFPAGASGKEPACQCRRHRVNPWSRKIPWGRHTERLTQTLKRDTHTLRDIHIRERYTHTLSEKETSTLRERNTHRDTHTKRDLNTD